MERDLEIHKSLRCHFCVLDALGGSGIAPDLGDGYLIRQGIVFWSAYRVCHHTETATPIERGEEARCPNQT